MEEKKEIKTNDEYTLKLKGSEVSLILQLVSQQPLMTVNSLYRTLEKQLEEQTK